MPELVDANEIMFTPFEPIVFNTLGPVGDKVEEWTLKGAFIQAANFGDMSFESITPAEITLTLRYDYAILQF